MELPRALWPWRQSLSIFPRDLAITLGGIVDKLALLFGPLVSPDGAGRNEPDGIDGIGRRGSFERLLATEWALAEEAPLEFLRRVSTGELSFLEIAHKKPAVARQCVALFDVGPDQRGGPRIVHLAALILLAQRAYDGGARFLWGVLQDPAGELVSDVNEESVRKLLKATSLRHIVMDDVNRFCQALEGDNAEMWFVGGHGTSEAIARNGAFAVKIEDSFDPEAPFDLHVSIAGERCKPRSIQLELPPSNVAIRLLRDPFQVARVTPQKTRVRVADKSNILFSRDYRKVFLRGADGELLTIPVPNSPNSKEAPKPRVFRPPPGEMLIGAGRLMYGRTIAAVTKDDDSILVHELSPRGCTTTKCKRYAWDRVSDVVKDVSLLAFDRGGDTSERLASLIQLRPNDELFLHDPPYGIFRLVEDTIRLWVRPVAVGHQEGSSLDYVQPGASPVFRSYTSARTQSLNLDPSARQFVLAPGGFIATNYSSPKWQVMNAAGELQFSMSIPEENEVLGFVTGKSGGFVVMDASNTRISFMAKDINETWFDAPAPIRTINVIPGCMLIAFLTVENELCIYSREHKALVLRLRLGDT